MDYLNRRIASVSVSPSLSIAPIFVAGRESKSIQIPISLIGANHKTAETVALVNCGAFGCFVNTTLVAHLGWQTIRLAAPQTAYNVCRWDPKQQWSHLTHCVFLLRLVRVEPDIASKKVQRFKVPTLVGSKV